MNKTLTLTILILLPALLFAGTAESIPKQSLKSTAGISKQTREISMGKTSITLTGPIASSESYTMKMNTGLISMLEMSSSGSYSLIGSINLPVMMVTPMSPAPKVSSALDTPETDELVITEYVLHQNYPNPFNPETNITFDLVDKGAVTLIVFNQLGQTVATLINRELPAGRHVANFKAENLPSGLYYFHLKAGDFSSVKKMILMK